MPPFVETFCSGEEEYSDAVQRIGLAAPMAERRLLLDPIVALTLLAGSLRLDETHAPIHPCPLPAPAPPPALR